MVPFFNFYTLITMDTRLASHDLIFSVLVLRLAYNYP